MVFETKKQRIVNSLKVADVENADGREFQVSPLFPYSNTSAIAVSSGTFLIDVETDTPTGSNRAGSGFRYSPFNNCRVVNNSNSDIIVYPNQQRAQGILITKKTAQTMDNQVIKGFNSMIIENIDSSNAVAVNEVRVLFWKDKVTTDELVKSIHAFIRGGHK